MKSAKLQLLVPNIFWSIDGSVWRLSSTGLLFLRVLIGLVLGFLFFSKSRVSRLANGRGNFALTFDKFYFLSAFFFLWMFFTKWTQHLALQTHAHDLGLFHSAIWNTLHGNFMVDSLRHQIFFSDHLIFLLVLFVPFYWIHSGPETLFVLSALAFALGISLIAKLVYERLGKRSLAVLFALVFGLNRYVWGAFLHEFHPDFFAPCFFFLLFFSVYKNWSVGFWVSLFLVLITKEDYALYLIPLGVYFMIDRKTRIRGFWVLIASVVYASFAFKWWLPYFYEMAGKTGSYSYAGSWGHLGNGFGEIAKTVLTHPAALFGNLSYQPMINLFLKFLFLPFAAPLTLIFLLPPLFLNASCGFPLIRNLSIHYGLIPAAFAFLAAIEGVRRIQKKNEPLAVLIIVVLIIVGLPRFSFFIPQRESAILRDKAGEWIQKEPMCVQSSLYPHLPVSHETSVYPECSGAAKFLLLNPKAEMYPLSKSEFDEHSAGISKEGKWKLIKEEGALLLFERN